MPATEHSPAERHANIERVAAQAAEAALCHYAYVNGVMFNDEQFEIQADGLSQEIARSLQMVDSWAERQRLNAV